jgi:hypothetical protein
VARENKRAYIEVLFSSRRRASNLVSSFYLIDPNRKPGLRLMSIRLADRSTSDSFSCSSSSSIPTISRATIINLLGFGLGRNVRGGTGDWSRGLVGDNSRRKEPASSKSSGGCEQRTYSAARVSPAASASIVKGPTCYFPVGIIPLFLLFLLDQAMATATLRPWVSVIGGVAGRGRRIRARVVCDAASFSAILRVGWRARGIVQKFHK